MSSQQTQPAQPQPLDVNELVKRPFVVVPPTESRLEQLHAQYATAKAEADRANEILKAITDAIKLEVTQLAPDGEQKVDLRSQHGPALRLAYTETWRFDSTRFKRDNPEAYVRYAKKSGAWSLRAVAGGDV